VFTTENTKDLPDPVTMFNGPNSDKLNYFKFTEVEVSRSLKRLRADKSGGPDNVKRKLLLELYEEVSQPLCLIFNKSMEESVVPQDWRIANACPIYKHGSRSQAENYRPVSLTSQVCKVFETLVRDSIVKHLEDNQLMRDTQHG
jgi:hypothetical protein